MRRSWFIAAIVLGIVAIAVAALAMRLTADDDAQPTTTEWADSVCTDLATWQSSLTSLTESGATLTRESLESKIDDAQSATQTLVTELKDLGAPDLESGDQLKQELDSTANQLETSFDTLKQSAKDASDADSPADFVQALAALGPQFQALLETASTSVDDLRNANVAEDAKTELQQAFDGSASCQQLQATS